MAFDIKATRDQLAHCADQLGAIRIPILDVDTINALLAVRQSVAECANRMTAEILQQEEAAARAAAPEGAPAADAAQVPAIADGSSPAGSSEDGSEAGQGVPDLPTSADDDLFGEKEGR